MAQGNYHLAQFNFALAKDDVNSPALRDFVAELDRINDLADRAEGFVWRLQTEAGNTVDIVAFPQDPRRLITLSVWESIESFVAFAYSGEHREIMRRRREWFERISEIYVVLWWIPFGTIPTVEDALSRLAHLKNYGPSAPAFTPKTSFPPPDF